MSNPIDLTDLQTVKAYLNITNTNSDALLTSLITAASQFIMSYCNRVFQAQAYTEYRDGLGNSELVTLGYPIISVQGVTINGRPIPASAPEAWPRSGYYAGQWYIGIEGYIVPRGRKNIVLSYTAGYETIPADLNQACVELVALKYKQKDRVGLSGSESIDGQSITYRDISMSEATRQCLAQYKRVIQIVQ